jgi:hypothetical protein
LPVSFRQHIDSDIVFWLDPVTSDEAREHDMIARTIGMHICIFRRYVERVIGYHISNDDRICTDSHSSVQHSGDDHQGIGIIYNLTTSYRTFSPIRFTLSLQRSILPEARGALP